MGGWQIYRHVRSLMMMSPMMMTQITLPQHGAGEASIAPVQLPQVCARVSDKNGPLPYESYHQQ